MISLQGDNRGALPSDKKRTLKSTKLMTERRTALAALPFLFCALFTGCGSGGIPPSTTVPPVTTGTGNWLITGYYEVSSNLPPYYIGKSLDIGGSLIDANGQLTGVFHINSSCFGSYATDVPYTGTLDSKNNLSITSSPVDGQILTLQGVLSSDGSILSRASFAVKGGCSGSIVGTTSNNGPGAEEMTTAERIPSLTNTWTRGVIDSGPAISEQPAQASAPDMHGDYALTGTVTAQGSPCFSQGTLQPGSFVSGDAGQEHILMDDGSTINATLQVDYGIYGATDHLKPQLYLVGTITGGKCNGPIGIYLQ